MRKSFLNGFGVLLICACASCHGFHNDGDVNITISENEEVFKMSSHFNKNKSRKVQKIMDKHLGRENNFSFVKTKMDAMLTLEDKTTFYIKSSPGRLEIKFNKDHNSNESYAEVKEMCEGIKEVLAKN